MAYDYDPIVIVQDGYSVEVIAVRPADEVSHITLMGWNQQNNMWLTIFDNDLPHPNPIRILGPIVPILGAKYMIQAMNKWGQSTWPMSGTRNNYVDHIQFDFTVEPGQTQIATSVTFKLQRVAYALLGSGLGSGEFDIELKRRPHEEEKKKK